MSSTVDFLMHGLRLDSVLLKTSDSPLVTLLSLLVKFINVNSIASFWTHFPCLHWIVLLNR